MALLPCSAIADDGFASFTGQLTGLKDSLIVLTPTANGEATRDTVLTKDGKFDFKVKVSKPTQIFVQTPGTIRRTEWIHFETIAVPGEKAVLSGDVKDIHYSGSKFYQEYNDADIAYQEACKERFEFAGQLGKAIQNGGNRDSLMNVYREKAPALKKQSLERMTDFIAKHPNSEGAAAYIAKFDDLDAMKKAVGLLADNVKNGRIHSYYQNAIDDLQKEADREAAAAKKQAAGVTAPDFTLNDINGKPLSLSSLKGKYVLLDFWGTWCIWCVRGIPKMKEYYEKYKGKFEILSIDCNESEDKWKEGVKKYELPWLHVYQPRQGNVQTTSLYAIQGFPTKILIGPDGKIVKTYVGEDPAFYEFLDKTFGSK